MRFSDYWKKNIKKSILKVNALDLKVGMKVEGTFGYSKIFSIRRLKGRYYPDIGKLVAISVVLEDGKSFTLSPEFDSLNILK